MNRRFANDAGFQGNNLKRFQNRIEEKYGLEFKDYWDFHHWSVTNYIELWAELWAYLGIVYSQPFSEVLEPNKEFEEVPKWFLGAQLNYAENLLNNPDDDVALILTGEDRSTSEKVTFGELREEVATLSSALRSVGVKRGDIIVCYMSNRKEVIVALLASASIGALFSAAMPLIGTTAVLARFEQLSPKVLFTIDRFVHMGTERNVLECLPALVEGLPTLEQVVIVSSKNESSQQDITTLPKSIFYHDLLTTGLLRDGDSPPPFYEQLPFNHPFLIHYTSGTTGPPKGVLHSAGSVLIGPLKNMNLCFNIKRTDIIFALEMPGWGVWTFFLAGLAVGAAQVVYEGFPFQTRQESYWDMLDKFKVSFTMIRPFVLENMEKLGNLPGSHNSLKNLHTIVSGTAHVKPRIFDFVKTSIKSDVFFSMFYGSTEVLMIVGGMNRNLPVHKGEIQASLLGSDMCCYNNEGESILDEKGELVIRNPFPTMPLFFWNDYNMEAYSNAFFKKFPGVWRQSDYCKISSKTGGITVYGRSDETLKQFGARFGASEIYSIVNRRTDVLDSLCVSFTNKDCDEIAALFVKMQPSKILTEELVSELRNSISSELSRRHVPKLIFQVKDIPYNVNSKRMELLVKRIFSKVKQLSSDTIVNPECLQEYIDIFNGIQS